MNPKAVYDGDDRAWEDRRGLVHWVPFTEIERFTACDIWLLWAPGMWSTRPVNCLTCLTFLNRKNEFVPPQMFYTSKLFHFQTEQLVHGVWADSVLQPMELETLCGVVTELILLRRAGAWIHDPVLLTCLGCLAAGHGDA